VRQQPKFKNFSFTLIINLLPLSSRNWIRFCTISIKLIMLRLIFFSLFSFALYFSTTAQMPNLDSLNLSTKISVDSSKLAVLRHRLADKTVARQTADADAQEHASDNAAAASDLNADPESKKLARKANHQANEAQSASKKARKMSDEESVLNRDISKQIALIEREQAKMSRYRMVNNPK
jgi:hypothetical protein